MIFQLPYCPAISMASWKILIKSLQIDMYSTGMALAHCMPLQEKHGKDKNAALEHDFKTLADVLIQVGVLCTRGRTLDQGRHRP